MTPEELNKIEQDVRSHKEKSQTSNIVLKVAQVERLINAARSAQPEAEVVDFNIAAEVRREEIQQRRYQQRWVSHARQQRFERQERERIQKINQRKQSLIDKWKNYAGSQQKQ